MPFDERIFKTKDIQKIKNQYQAVNKIDGKFDGQIPATMEYKNSKQKMQFLNIGSTDETPLLGIDWMQSSRRQKNPDEHN